MTYDKYSLWGDLDSYVTRPKFRPGTDQRHLWPSEASVKFYDQHGDLTVEGKCMRAAYLRVKGDFEALPPSAYSEWIFEMGRRVEKMIVDRCKEAGIYVDNSIKFYDEEYNVSGEIDVLLTEPDGLIYPAEIKSAYGYYAEKEIMGNMKQRGQPKMGQLLQLLIYLWKFKDQFPYGRMVYFFRDSTKRRTFKVELEQQGNILYPKVEGQVIKTFSVNDILARYKELQHHIDNEIVPEKDYELQYPEAKIHDFAKKGKIGKTKYQNFLKGKLKDYEYLGDWNCRGYCPYSRICYEDAVFPAKEHL